MNNRRLKLNAITSIIQTVTSAIALVILYRYLIDIIGVARFGVWSLVVGISSLVGAGNLGLTGSLVKYVADYDVVNDNIGMSRAIQTGVLTTAIISLVVVTAGYPLGQYYLRVTLTEDLLHQAMEILPIALAAFWIMMLTCQISDQHSFVNVNHKYFKAQ
jgi:O-antigen/teichoic acid export membrane protein